MEASHLALIGPLIGGLGLFLLGMGMMTDGLKLAAGPAFAQESATTPPNAPAAGNAVDDDRRKGGSGVGHVKLLCSPLHILRLGAGKPLSAPGFLP